VTAVTGRYGAGLLKLGSETGGVPFAPIVSLLIELDERTAATWTASPRQHARSRELKRNLIAVLIADLQHRDTPVVVEPSIRSVGSAL